MFLIGFFRMMLIGVIVFIVLFMTSIFNGFTLKKQEAIEVYDTIIQTFSTVGLSKDRSLSGKRKFGIDKYVGTYQAKYNNKTGEEILFGGTSLQRKNSDHIKLKIKVTKESGNINVIEKLRDKEITVLSDTGEYEGVVYVEGMTYYLSLKLDKFKGSVDIIAQ